MTDFTLFWEKVNNHLNLGTPTIAFGLAQPDEQILESLKRSKKYARIILVGPPKIDSVTDFDLVVDDSPERRIASMLAADEVDGIIRGTIADTPTRRAYRALTGEKAVANPILCETPESQTPKRQFWLTLTSNLDGWTPEARLIEAKAVAQFLKGWGLQPLIAVYAAVRQWHPEAVGVAGTLMQSYKDAEWIASELEKSEFSAKNWTIDLNPAVEDGYNIHVPVNGMVGNQIFRAILICGGRVLASPMLGLSRPYDDTSRTEKDIEPHVKWLAAYINMKKLTHTVR